jgi:hypothetical protein
MRRRPTGKPSLKDRRKEAVRRMAELTEAEREVLTGGEVRRINGGEPYSVRNQMLILMQLPTATVCGGFWDWQKVGRSVRKGESALAISGPPLQPRRGTDEVEEDDDRHGGFCPAVATFDISQTEPVTVREALRDLGVPAEADVVEDEVLQLTAEAQGFTVGGWYGC